MKIFIYKIEAITIIVDNIFLLKNGYEFAYYNITMIYAEYFNLSLGFINFFIVKVVIIEIMNK